MELNKTFIDGLWSKEINVTSFVQTNITPYLGDASFLQGPTERTKHIWNLCLKALEEERANNGVRSLDNATVSTITSHKAGYIDREQELIVGLQTDELLKRAIKPFGGINVVSRACKENGVDVDEKVRDIFTHYRKTHNDGVFDVYTEEIRSFRSLGFLMLGLLSELSHVKWEYDKVAGALEEVRRTGYGIVVPGTDELVLEEPEIVRQGGRYGVRLKASAPSIHMIRADIETEVSPIVGNEKQSEEMVNFLLQEFEGDTKAIWQSNIFGKSFHELVSEDLNTKLKRMPDDARGKLQETLQRIINEGSGGLICIIL